MQILFMSQPWEPALLSAQSIQTQSGPLITFFSPLWAIYQQQFLTACFILPFFFFLYFFVFSQYFCMESSSESEMVQ